MPDGPVDMYRLSILLSFLAVRAFVLFRCPRTGNPMACWRPFKLPTVRWCAMSARICRRRSSSIIRFVIGSDLAGGGSRCSRVDVLASRDVDACLEGAEGALGGSNGLNGVEGRGAAAGDDSRADRALSCGSDKSPTRIWSWNCNRAMIRAEVW